MPDDTPPEIENISEQTQIPNQLSNQKPWKLGLQFCDSCDISLGSSDANPPTTFQTGVDISTNESEVLKLRSISSWLDIQPHIDMVTRAHILFIVSD